MGSMTISFFILLKRSQGRAFVPFSRLNMDMILSGTAILRFDDSVLYRRSTGLLFLFAELPGVQTARNYPCQYRTTFNRELFAFIPVVRAANITPAILAVRSQSVQHLRQLGVIQRPDLFFLRFGMVNAAYRALF